MASNANIVSLQEVTSITRKNAKKVLEVVDAGLVSGLGIPKPGYMCVEAAVNYALGLPHGDNPDCVAPSLRSLKIRLNDSSWSSPAARAKGLRRLAIAQLGSAGALDEKEFRKRIVDYALRISTPKALRSAASICRNADHKQKLLDAANKCEVEGSRKAAQEARVAAAYAAAHREDQELESPWQPHRFGGASVMKIARGGTSPPPWYNTLEE